MKRRASVQKIVSLLLSAFCFCLTLVCAHVTHGADFADVETILGVKGQMQEGVTVFRFPRSDIQVEIDGEPVPTALGFGGWTAWKAMGNEAMVMGDLVLLEKEVNGVISALGEANINISALHNHFLNENPRIMFVHVDGMGDPQKLARGLKNALARTGTPFPSPTGAQPSPPPAIDTKRIEQIIGEKGQVGGGVFKITIGRPGVTMRGTEVTSSMGLNTWAAFIGTSTRAHVAGDVAMTAREVNPVIRALRRGGINVVAVHNHMLDEEPRIFFLHYWGTGTAEELAHTLRAAFDHAKGPVR
jgi:Domain of Unknown Function (DUF1259)